MSGSGTRLLDRVAAAVGLVVLAPVLGVAAVGVRLSSRGPILYRAPRVGRDGAPFTLYKFRTMHVDHGTLRSAITAHRDPRIFPFGAFLRETKIDELPQLFNILRGEMAVIGPRPEDPRIVAEHYRPEYMETLTVLPGLSSPGSIYYYTHANQEIEGEDPERVYVERVLPVKLALDVVYVRNRSLLYDLRLVGRTIYVILAKAAGKRRFRLPPEWPTATRLLASWGVTVSTESPHPRPGDPRED